MNENYKDCRFYNVDNETNKGFCRKHPPIISPKPGGWEFPHCWISCGEFEAKETYVPLKDNPFVAPPNTC